MVKRILSVTVVVVMFFFGFYVGRLKLTTVYAQVPAPTGDVHNIPKTWGTFKGGVLSALVFEDSNGTLRLVSLEENKTVKLYLTLTRQ